MTGKKGVSGRKCSKGYHSLPSQQLRASYTIQFKQSVLEYFGVNGAPKTISHFWPGLDSKSPERERRRQLIYHWKKNSAKIAESATSATKSNSKKIRPLGTSALLTPDIEDEIYFWVRSLRKEGVSVSANTLRIKVLSICQQYNINNFFASFSWMRNFKNKYNLSLRAESKKQVSGGLSGLEAEQFAIEVKNKMLELGVDCVWNGDQSPLNYETIPNMTLDEMSTKTVSIKTIGKEIERVSVLLLGSSTGIKKEPFIIFKGKPTVNTEISKKNTINQRGFGTCIWKKIQEISKTSNSQTYCNQNGWFTSGIIIEWLYYHFSLNTDTPKILLLDDFPANWADEVITTANLLNITLMKIPSGVTSICQPADISWHRPFQSYLREKWTEKLKIDVTASEVLFKTKAPSREVLIQWIDSAWDYLSSTTIISGFSKPGYTL